MKIDMLQAVVAEVLRKEEELRCLPETPGWAGAGLFEGLDITSRAGDEFVLTVQSRNAAMHAEVVAIFSRFAVDVQREVADIPFCARAK